MGHKGKKLVKRWKSEVITDIDFFGDLKENRE